MTAFGFSVTIAARHTGKRVFKVDALRPPVTSAGQKTGHGAAVSQEVRSGRGLTGLEFTAGTA